MNSMNPHPTDIHSQRTLENRDLGIALQIYTNAQTCRTFYVAGDTSHAGHLYQPTSVPASLSVMRWLDAAEKTLNVGRTPFVYTFQHDMCLVANISYNVAGLVIIMTPGGLPR